MPENTQNINSIKILPDFIANQIAAGEVVQCPESIVKELVENSIDAGADTIFVVVRGAGKQLLHIVDNGSGMSKDDLLLSCKRHATSKIISAEDLEEIRTFGFRGEALASISAVANVEIRTKRQNDEHGWKLFAEPMKTETVEPCITDTGTQVFVRNLFFNVPARRKFLKSNLTEFRYISDTMMKFALSKPNIRFTFYDEDSLIFDAHPEPIIRRIGNILGENTANSLIPVELEREMIRLSGFVGQPHIAKQTRSGQYLFLNGRSIISKSLGHAVYSAFEHLLDKSANPFYILNIELDPKNFDVNVHPQKHEVKFEDERHIYGIINKAVSMALQRSNLAPEVTFNYRESQSPFEKMSFSSGGDKSDLLLVNKLTGEIIDTKPNYSAPQSFGSRFDRDYRPGQFQQQSGKPPDISAYDLLFQNKEANQNNAPINVSEQGRATAFYWQLHNKYIFTQTESGIMIIDQHAAHERVLYERAVKAIDKQFAYSQDLLFPVVIKLNSSELTIVREIENDFQSLGYHFTVKEPDTVHLTSVPNDVKTGDEAASFREIIQDYDLTQKVKPSDKRDNLAASYSCKAAIKTGQSLSIEEMKRLIHDLFQCETPYACPHGRPVIIEISTIELDKRFKRIL